MDGYRKYNLKIITKFIDKNGKVLVASAVIVFMFSLIYSGKVYDIPYFGQKLLGNSLEKEINSPQTSELNKLRLKAISDAIKAGGTEYTYEVPALLGPK